MATAAANEFRSQWTQPSDTFSVLLIVGGDVIQLTLANLTGGIFTPIAFSFGWVAYAITAALGAMSDNRLISCRPEVPVKVFNLETSYGRDNQSWLLSRLVKTYDTWMPAEVRAAVDSVKAEVAATTAYPPPPKDQTIGLCVTVYTWNGKAGKPCLDYVWWSGLVVTAVQLGVAAIPFALRRNWAVFLAAVSGTFLAYASASLPHWRKEKYYSREGRKKKDFALTRGQGSQHVIIVVDAEETAGVARQPRAMGLPINNDATRQQCKPEVYAERKVMWTLMELEMKHPKFGKALLPEFFPGPLRDWERKWWGVQEQERRGNLDKNTDFERRKELDKRKESEKEKQMHKKKELGGAEV